MTALGVGVGVGLELERLRITLHGRELLPPISAVVEAGSSLTVMGPSGSGKSTLLACIAGTLAPAFAYEGRVRVGGSEIDDLPPERRRVGILFQDDLLFPHLSVGGNLAFAMPAHIKPRAERQQRIDAALAAAGLPGYAARDPATLSGGQRARVAVMRTLLAEPLVLLLDEPFSKLDAQLRDDFRRFVFKHARAQSLPTVLVTHDEADAQAAGGVTIRL